MSGLFRLGLTDHRSRHARRTWVGSGGAHISLLSLRLLEAIDLRFKGLNPRHSLGQAHDLAKIAAGAPIILTVVGNVHPPVMVSVGPVPEDGGSVVSLP